MNERIRELAEEARRKPTGDTWVYRTYGEFEQEFAERIVLECVKVVDDMADSENSQRYLWAIQNASSRIKEHFGITNKPEGN